MTVFNLGPPKPEPPLFSVPTQSTRLKELLGRGVLTEAEYERALIKTNAVKPARRRYYTPKQRQAEVSPAPAPVALPQFTTDKRGGAEILSEIFEWIEFMGGEIKPVEVFFMVDSDGSGAMDEEEFTEALARMGMGSLNQEQVRAAFLSLDEDGGGSIEIEEFMSRLRREKKWRLRHAALKLSPKSRELLAADPLQPAAAGGDSASSQAAVDPFRDDSTGIPLTRKRIELSISCADLPVVQKSHGLVVQPVFAVLSIWLKKDRRWQEHGRTEVVREAQPSFVRSFWLDYMHHNDNYSGDHDQWVKIVIYIRKSQLTDLSRHVEHGEAIFTLRDVYRVPINRVSHTMPAGGAVIARVAEHAVDERPGFVEFEADAAGFKSTANPFLQGAY